ncbi:glutathione peroxidase 7-like [Ischnura elegans]|uniref:glutathione peroxidase 7-like n=1 Tax=Ischnura elegans TaxID=197161 RepID=UPI001ED8B7A0|nr:glutathione peroxidase 7-like [Ischnura elegans]
MAFIIFLLLLCFQNALSFGKGQKDFYSFSVKNIKGEEVALEIFRGQVSLVINVASECGYTDSHYRALKRLYDILSFNKKFNILAFPCNQFGGQEPSEDDQIEEFALNEYGVEFPLFSKIEVIGENADPAFKNLIEQSKLQPDWNFYKYLVSHDGVVINAWDTKTSVEDIFPDIERAVKVAESVSTDPVQEQSSVPREDL